jgi:hypothetical protein
LLQTPILFCLFDTTTDSHRFKLTASDAAADDWFGNSVAISGNTAVVGAIQDDDGSFDSGSAYLFTPEPSTFVLATLGLLSLGVTRRRRRRA